MRINMAEIDSVKMINETRSIINYFKLLGVCKLTKYQGDTKAFDMLEGKEIYQSIQEDEKNNLINLKEKNIDALNKLLENLSTLSEISLSNLTKKDFSKLDWISFAVQDINMQASLDSTLTENINLIYKNSVCYMKDETIGLTNDIESVSKKFKKGINFTS